MNKYRNKKVEVNGEKFDSKKEAARWCDLLLLERAGAIKGLRRQVPFAFEYEGVKIGKYVADFVYVENGCQVVEDSKSLATLSLGVYRLKKRMMKAFYGVEIRET